MSYRCDECNQTTGRGQKLLKRIVYRTVLHKEGVQGQQIANEIKLCPGCMKAQPAGSPKPITKSTELDQKVWIFLRTIRHLKGTKRVQLAKDFARKYLTLDQDFGVQGTWSSGDTLLIGGTMGGIRRPWRIATTARWRGYGAEEEVAATEFGELGAVAQN